MHFKTIPLGAFEANSIVIWDDPSSAIVVDPGADGDFLVSYLENEGVVPKVVFLTHGHFDHISGVDEIVNRYKIPVFLHKDDEELAFSQFNLSQPYYKGFTKNQFLDLTIQDGICLPGFDSAKVLHTPGHSPGSSVLYFEDYGVLVSGDTLFAGSIGRTDLPGGSYKVIQESLKRLVQLPEDTRVICGHGPETTIGKEIKTNPFL